MQAIDRFAGPVALVAGALSALAFQPVGLWPLMILAFLLLCELVVRAGSLRRALLIGWLFGLGQFAVGLNWIATAFTFQAAMPAWLGWIAVILLSLYLAVYPMLSAGLAKALGRGRPLATVLALAGGWGVTEWLRAGIFTGFAWNPVGAILADTPLLKASSLVGTYGLSMLVVLAGAAIWLAGRMHWRSAAVALALPLLALAVPAPTIPEPCCLSAGGPDSPPPPRMTEAQQRQYLRDHRIWNRARIVQPNIGQEDKWRPGFSEVAAGQLAGLSGSPAERTEPRLLFWPEAAVTEPLEDARTDEHQAFAEYERTRAAALVRPGEYLLTGGIALESDDGVNVTGAANSVFVIGAGGQLLYRYDKAHLVPFGEYLPLRPLLSSIGLSRLAPGSTDFIPGPGPRTVALPGWGKVGFQLCYEIIFSGEVVDRGNRPDFIFNPSNDAWFGRWGPPQHLAQARLRAAEEAIPVVRSTPTGISALIDGRGRLIEAIGWKQAGVIDVDLPPAAAEPTLFGRFGNIIPILLGFVLIISAIVLGRSRRYIAADI